MISMKLLQCWVLLIFIVALMNLDFASHLLIASGNFAESSTKAKDFYKEIDELQKRLDLIDRQLDWLRKEKDGCILELRRVRHDLDQTC